MCIHHLCHAICPHGPLHAGCATVLPHAMLFLCVFHAPTSKGVVILRTLIQGYYRAHTKSPTAQAHVTKGPKGPPKSVLGPWGPWKMVSVWRIGVGFCSSLDTCNHQQTVRNTQRWVVRTTQCLGATYLIVELCSKIKQRMRAQKQMEGSIKVSSGMGLS